MVTLELIKLPLLPSSGASNTISPCRIVLNFPSLLIFITEFPRVSINLPSASADKLPTMSIVLFENALIMFFDAFNLMLLPLIFNELPLFGILVSCVLL